MNNTLPLNGERLLAQAKRAMASPADLITQAIESNATTLEEFDEWLNSDPEEQEPLNIESTSAGTGNFVDSLNEPPAKQRATDPSQGAGSTGRSKPQDPLLAGIMSVIHRAPASGRCAGRPYHR